MELDLAQKMCHTYKMESLQSANLIEEIGSYQAQIEYLEGEINKTETPFAYTISIDGIQKYETSDQINRLSSKLGICRRELRLLEIKLQNYTQASTDTPKIYRNR